MAKLRIQINGEDVQEIEGDISLVEIKSSQGYVGEFVPDGLARVNVVVNTRGDYATHISEAHPESNQPVEPDTDHKPVEEQQNEEEEITSLSSDNDSMDFKLPTE